MQTKVEGIVYNDLNQPRSLYMETLREFRHKLGDKAFWADSGAQDTALYALAQDYLRTEHGEFLDEDADHYKAAISEYEMRREMLSRRKIK